MNDQTDVGPTLPPDDHAHQVLRETLGAYALDLLDEAETAQITRHLQTCELCRAEVSELSGLGAMLREVDLTRLELPDPVPELTPELERAIAERLDDTPPPADVIPLRRPRRWLAVASGAAAGLLLVGGLGGYLLAPRPPEVPFEPVPVVVAQAGTEATAGVIPHTWGVEIRMTASGFTAGEHYVVKVIDDTGAQRDAGEFVGTGDQPMVCNLNSSVLRDDAAGFVVFDDNDREVVTSQF